MHKKCIVNYITQDTWHPSGQDRLRKSLEQVGFEDDILLFNNNNFNCVSHKEIPYAFKFHVLREIQKRNYELALWVDASFWAIKNIDNLMEEIYRCGFLVQNSGYSVGQWTSDDCLREMGVNRKDAFDIPLFSGGLMGFNFHNKKIFDFFEEFYRYAKEGRCFRGPWRKNQGEFISNDERVSGHRHDMSVGSILMKRFGMTMFPNNTFFNYYAWYEKYRTEMDLSHVYFLIEGGPRELPLKEI